MFTKEIKPGISNKRAKLKRTGVGRGGWLGIYKSFVCQADKRIARKELI